MEEAVGGNETLLLIDDEKMIIEVGRKMMESLGYVVVAAGKGEEALTLYRKRYDHIDLIILDMIMPYMGGKDVFNRIKEGYVLGYHKAAKLAEINLWAEIYAVTNLSDATLQSIFIKPFNSLQEAINEALKKRGRDAKVLFLLDGSLLVPTLN